MITRAELIEALMEPHANHDGAPLSYMSRWAAEIHADELIPLIGYSESEAFDAGWDAALNSFAGAHARLHEAFANLAASIFEALNWRKK